MSIEPSHGASLQSHCYGDSCDTAATQHSTCWLHHFQDQWKQIKDMERFCSFLKAMSMHNTETGTPYYTAYCALRKSEGNHLHHMHNNPITSTLEVSSQERVTVKPMVETVPMPILNIYYFWDRISHNPGLPLAWYSREWLWTPDLLPTEMLRLKLSTSPSKTL